MQGDPIQDFRQIAWRDHRLQPREHQPGHKALQLLHLQYVGHRRDGQQVARPLHRIGDVAGRPAGQCIADTVQRRKNRGVGPIVAARQRRNDPFIRRQPVINNLVHFSLGDTAPGRGGRDRHRHHIWRRGPDIVLGGSHIARVLQRAAGNAALRFRQHTHRNPHAQRQQQPAAPRRKGPVPAEHGGRCHRARRGNQAQRRKIEAGAGNSRAGGGKLQRFDRIAAGKERRGMLRPSGKALQPHRHAADHQHGQEDALAQCLHRRHIVHQHGDHHAEGHEGRRRDAEGNQQGQWMQRCGHAEGKSERQLQQRRGQQQYITRGQDTDDEHPAAHGRQGIASPDPAFAFADDGGRQAETGAAQNGDGEELAQMQRQRHRIAAIDRPEGHQENQRKQIAVQHRHPVAKIQLQAEDRQVQQRRHRAAVNFKITSSSVLPDPAISSRGLPMATIRPLAITAMRSQSCSASAMSWVVSSTARLASFMPRI